MKIVTDGEALAPFRGGVLIPTMGALHEGHIALVRRGAELAARDRLPVVVSVFVNPTQFGPAEDFTRYPRTLEADVEACRSAGADAVFAPPVEVMYPPPPAPSIPVPPLPPVATRPGLEDTIRPGHFAGVCQVVRRLFEFSDPAMAVFGEKDWQQLRVVTAMAAAEKLRVRIIPEPTRRDPDGLAMSSRNRFLSPDDRRRGLAISRALRAAAAVSDVAGAEAAMRAVLAAEGIAPDYAVVRNAETLEPFNSPRPAEPGRALIAARVGTVRLIDNAPWPGGAGAVVMGHRSPN